MGGGKKSPAVRRGVVADDRGTRGTYKSAVVPAGNSSVPKDNRSSRLREGTTRLKKSLSRAKEVVTGEANRSSKDNPKHIIELSQTLTPMRQKRPKPTANINPPSTEKTPTASTTMTIEQIQPRLENAVKNSWPNKIIGLISNNHETINKEFDSGGIDLMELILQAAHNVKDKSTGKTAHEIAKKLEKSEFLEVTQNALKKLIEKGCLYKFDLRRQRSFSTLTYFEKIEGMHNEQKANFTQSCTNLLLLDDKLSIEEKLKKAYKEFDIIYCLVQLQSAIESNTVHNIINIISDNLELINQELEGDKKDEIVELLTKVACVHNEKEGNTIFHILASYTNLSEKEIKILELFNSLGNVMPGAMEVENKDGKTALDIAENSDNQNFINIIRTKLHKLPEWNRPDASALQPSTSSSLNSILSAAEKIGDQVGHMQILPEAVSEKRKSGGSVGSDSGINSPGPSESAEDSESPINSRSGSLTSATSISSNGNLSSRTGSLNSLYSAELSDDGTLKHLTKTRPKGPIHRTPSKHSRRAKDYIQQGEPTPDVIPVLDTGIQGKQDMWIPVSATRMTSYLQKEESIEPQQETPNNGDSNKDTTLTKQPNDRNFYIALTAVCTLGTIACFATAGLYFMSAKKTELAASSIAVIGALCVIGIGFAIAAVTTWCLTPSSEVESMSVHTLANGKQR